MVKQEPTIEELQKQLLRQNKLIQALQSEVGVITGDKLAVSVAYQEVNQELIEIQEEKVKEMDGDVG